MRSVQLQLDVGGATTPQLDGVQLFEAQPRLTRFSGADLVRFAFGVLAFGSALVISNLATRTVGGLESDITALIERFPETLAEIIIRTAQMVATFVPGVAIVALLWFRRWRVLLHVVVSALAGWVVLSLVLPTFGQRAPEGSLARQALAADVTSTAADFPSTGYLASIVAAVTVGALYVPRRWRRALWGWVTVLILLRLLGPGQPPLDALIGVATGTVVGSAVLLLLGSPSSEPTPVQVLLGLRSAGIDPVAIERNGQSVGSVHYTVTEDEGQRWFVKLRTPDDRSWDVLSRAYRAVRLRSSQLTRAYSTLKRRVEHEALVLHVVHEAGAHAPRLITLGAAPGGAVFLVEEMIEGTRLSDLDPARFDDPLIRSVLDEVAHIHRARTAHHHLTLDNFVLDEHGDVRSLDFDDAELAATPRDIARDVAEILVAIGSVVGPERAVDAAIEVLGTESVSASLPLLQPLALSYSLGKQVRRQRGLLDELRRRIHDRTGVDDVPLERLARVQPRTLLMIIAGSVAFYSLLPQFGNLDETFQAFGDAELVWLLPMLAAAATYYVSATISFLGSVAQPMPLAASARSQVASLFAQLVGPAGSGKMALAGRFLQRNGLTGSEASASVALNTVAGVATHLLLMAGFFAWAGEAGIGGVSLPNAATVLIVLALAAVLILIATTIPPIRVRLVTPVANGLRSAAGYSGQVLRSPVRVVGLLGGSTLNTLCYLTAAVFAVQAFGGGLAIAEIGATFLGAAAIANIAPTPGGLGPLEAAMIAGFTGFGMHGGTAISAVLTFRLATFWLPILPGWLAFMAMERRGEI